MPVTRRRFCTQTALALVTWSPLFAEAQVGTAGVAGSSTAGSGAGSGAGSTARPNVAAIDRDRILSAAQAALRQAPRTLTAYPAPQSPGGPGDFYSGADGPGAAGGAAGAAAASGTGVQVFSAHREALLNLTLWVPALVAGYVLLRGTEADTAEQFAKVAMDHLRAWFVDPATRMTPSLQYGGMVAGVSTPQFDGVIETVGLAEVAVAVAALPTNGTITAADLAGVRAWFSEYLEWLMTTRVAGLARDQKDHHGSSWLLQTSAFALLTRNETVAAELRHRYKTVTIRAQIVADGVFPHELTTPAPYRNSLFNLDMLAGVTDLLSTRFENLWDFQLQDGPGMRVAMARFFPYIERRSTWPYKADLSHFAGLPCRRPSLLFAARAYSRPEYADVWRSLRADPTDPVVLAAFPIRQPLLWVMRQRV